MSKSKETFIQQRIEESFLQPLSFSEYELESLRVFDLEDNPMKQYGRDCKEDYLRTFKPNTNEKN
jgi:hypothetical protein